ncbi:MAG: VOC family protein [Phormidesmis sp.]
MQLTPYLSFDGQCEAAFKFYEQCLGGKASETMTWGDSPMADEVSSDWHEKVVHTSLSVGDTEIMGADMPPGQYEKPQGFSVSVNIDDPTEADRAFKALAENGTVKMPIQETFWATRFGMLVDRFGIPWMVNCDKAA